MKGFNMKKKILLTCIVGVSIAMLATFALAKETAAAKNTNAKAGTEGQWLADKIIKLLNITDPAKETQIRQICQTRHQEMDKWRKENGQKVKELHEQIKAAREAKDQAKVKELQSQLKPMREARQKIQIEFLQQLDGVLTSDQVSKVKNMMKEGILTERHVQHMMGKLELSTEQKAKVDEIIKAAHQAAENAEEFQDKEKIWNDTLQKIANEVLTPQQRTKLEELKKHESEEAASKESTTKPAKEKKTSSIKPRTSATPGLT